MELRSFQVLVSKFHYIFVCLTRVLGGDFSLQGIWWKQIQFLLGSHSEFLDSLSCSDFLESSRFFCFSKDSLTLLKLVVYVMSS